MFLASDYLSSNLSALLLPLLFLSFLRFLSVVVQKKSEQNYHTPQGVHMNNKSQRRKENKTVLYVGCFFETVWAAMVSGMVSGTSLVQGNLALAKNIISNR